MCVKPTTKAAAALVSLLLLVVVLGSCQKKAAVDRAEVARITAEEVKARMDRGDALTFVDSRSHSSWETAVSMIPGAFRVPPDEIDRYISDVPKGKPVIVYCT
jgi:3-mercaptopyruvate sulfurtransferase SseA